MKEELLKQLREELEEQKLKNEKYNNKIKRIRELKKYPNVKEYIKLTGFDSNDLKLIKQSDKEIIISIYRRHLYNVKQCESNKIYVYLGTFSYSDEIDIIHGSSDNRVNYDSSNADYRIYWDIEQINTIQVPILHCKQFENENIIINPKSYFKEKEYYKIQEEFFIESIKTNQESAKKLILNKYDKLNKQ